MASRWLATAVQVVLLAPPADAWVSTSQARFGLTIEQLQAESRGITDGIPQYSLGYLWNQPPTTDNARGLGKSISWQWDNRLCDELKVEENFWGIPLSSCASLKASMHRAFDAWAQNSRHIKFTEVSDFCAAIGYSRTRCPHAEIFVTSFAGLNHSDIDEADGPPIVSMQLPEHTEQFRFTNGEFPFRTLGSGVNGSNVQEVRRMVTEVTGATIAFRTQGLCWYLDTEFCSGFHDWKQIWETPTGAYAVGVTAFFTLWFSIMCCMACQCSCGTYRALRQHARVKADSDIDMQAPGPHRPRAEKVSAVINSFSACGMALRLLLIIIVWPMYTATFVTCWSCYDFESAAAHEIGHILGLGHPELTPRETLGGYAATGQNAFHSHLANGISFSNVTCKSPWDGVVAGVPEHAPTDPRWSLVQVRPSIMFDFTLDHPRSCLELDDLEALNVLYPDCHVATLMDPQCIKSPLNLGWMRLALAIASFALCYAFASGALGWARYIRGDFKHARKDLRRRLGRASRAYGDVNLDEPPETRWNHIAKAYKSQVPAVQDYLNSVVPKWALPLVEGAASNLVGYFREYGTEMQAMAKVWGVSPGLLVVMNLIMQVEEIGLNCSNWNVTGPTHKDDPGCEIIDPKQEWCYCKAAHHAGAITRDDGYVSIFRRTAAFPVEEQQDGPRGMCTSVVAQAADGTIALGRNLDWNLPPSVRGIIIDIDFVKGGKKIFRGTGAAGAMGVFNGMAYASGAANTTTGAWTGTIDARGKGGKLLVNIFQALLAHSLTPCHHLRMVLESARDFESAVTGLSKTPQIDENYFIVAGTKRAEGAVIARGREKAADVWRLDPSEPTGWYRLQTNYDHWDPVPTADDRRHPGYKLMNDLTAARVAPASMWGVITTYPVFNSHTDFSLVSVPSLGLYNATTWMGGAH